MQRDADHGRQIEEKKCQTASVLSKSKMMGFINWWLLPLKNVLKCGQADDFF